MDFWLKKKIVNLHEMLRLKKNIPFELKFLVPT